MKRIVCDIDDTISVTTSRDWENAAPIQPVIDKINDLFAQGWEVYLVTARGSISCKTREEADKKYRAQIEAWLAKHNVHYTLLSFEKYLAAYYIDDKSITPEEFVKLDIRNLQNGWSGATVELRDGRVYKTADNSIHAAAWYDKAKSFFEVPRVHSLIGSTICLEYIKSNDKPVKIYEIVSIIDTMMNIPFITTNQNDFRYYERRISDHLRNMGKFFAKENRKSINDEALLATFDNIWPKFSKMFGYMHNNATFKHVKSFCHGDFSIENIINTDKGPVLIDPIYEAHKDTWSSWLIDLSKMLHSLRKHGRKEEYHCLLKHYVTRYEKTGITQDVLQYLEIMQFIRVFKYAPETVKPSIIYHIRDIFHDIEFKDYQNEHVPVC